MPSNKTDLTQALPILILRLVLTPLKAVFSREFYFQVLFARRGVGFLYLFLLCVVLAIPAAARTSSVMHYFKSLDLPSLVAQIPASYLDDSGTLSPNSSGDAYAEIKNSQGQVVMVYNTQGKALEGAAADAPIEFGARDMIFHNLKGGLSVPYVGIFPTGTSFQPLQSAQSLESVLGSGVQLIWSVLVMSMYVFLVFNALISACLARFMMVFIFRIKMGFGTTLRLCSYANTLVAFIMVAQFFVFLPMSYTIMALVPLAYVALFSQRFRMELARDGVEGMYRNHGGIALEVPPVGRQDGARRDTSVYSGNMYAQEQERLKREGGKEGRDEGGDGAEPGGQDQDGSGAGPGGQEGGNGAGGGGDDNKNGGGDDDNNKNGGGKGTGGYFEA